MKKYTLWALFIISVLETRGQFPAGTSVQLQCVSGNCTNPCPGDVLTYSVQVTGKNDSEIASFFYLGATSSGGKGLSVPSNYPPGFHNNGYVYGSNYNNSNGRPINECGSKDLYNCKWSIFYDIYINDGYQYSITIPMNYSSYVGTPLDYSSINITVPNHVFNIRANLRYEYTWRPISSETATSYCGTSVHGSCTVVEDYGYGPIVINLNQRCRSNFSSGVFNYQESRTLSSNSISVSGVKLVPGIEGILGPSTVDVSATNIRHDVSTGMNAVEWNVSSGATILRAIPRNRAIEWRAPSTSGIAYLTATGLNYECQNYKIRTVIGVNIVNTPPSTPVLSGDRISNTTLRLGWSPSNDVGGTVSSYKIYRTQSMTFVDGRPTAPVYGSDIISVPSNAISRLVTSTGESWYALRITAIDNEGLESAPSANIYYQVDNVPPPAPNGLVVTNTGSGLYRLTWNAVTDFSGIKRYEIWYNGERWRTSNNSTFSFSKGELGSALSHSFTVSAIDELNNESTQSSAVSFDLDAKAPSVPGNIKLSEMNYDRVTASWDASIDNSTFLPVYNVYLYDWYSKAIITTVTTTGSPYTVTGLMNGEKYALGISASDIYGNESSQSVIPVYIDLSPPSNPTGLTTITGQSTLRRLGIRWNASTDPEGNLIGYYVYKDGNQLNIEPVVNTQYTVTGVADVYKSEYTVKAVDFNGNLSGESNKLTVSPPVLVIDPNTIRVGIGVFNPEERLDVDENIQINDGNLVFRGSDGKKIYPKDGGDLKIHTVNTISGNTIFNTNVGNVGIGKTNPDAKLDVSGSIKASQTVSGNHLLGQTLQAQQSAIVSMSGHSLTANNVYVTTLNSYNIYNNSSIFTDGLKTQNLTSDMASVKVLVTTTLGVQNVNVEKLISNDAELITNFTENLTVASSLTVLNKNSFPAAYWEIKNGVMTNPNNLHNEGRMRIGQSLYLEGSTLTGTNIYAQSKDLYIQSNFNSGHTILNNEQGTVFIGELSNTISGLKLDVGGDLRTKSLIIKGTSINHTGGMSVSHRYPGFLAVFGSGLDAPQTRMPSLTTTSLVVASVNGINDVVNISSNQLNISANTQINSLTLTGNNRFTIHNLTGTGMGLRVVFVDDRGQLNTDGQLYQTWSNVSSNPNNIYYNKGNVGIGTDVIRGALDIYGAANTRMYVRNAKGGLLFAGVDSEHAHGVWGVQPGDYVIGTNHEWVADRSQMKNLYFNMANDNSEMRFTLGNNATNVMMSLSNETVKIFKKLSIEQDATFGGSIEVKSFSNFNGDATFKENMNIGKMLTVGDRVDAKEFRACLAPGSCPPDYVFEKDYKLMSLDELRKYLATNKHLPEVPSAKEMLQNGVNMSEMNLTLLKKIEELSLYILQLEERVKKVEGK